jgi:hypothetical protein
MDLFTVYLGKMSAAEDKWRRKLWRFVFDELGKRCKEWSVTYLQQAWRPNIAVPEKTHG